MKAGWQSKTLKEVCVFSNGLWKGEKPPFVHVGVIRNTNFRKDGLLDDSDIAFLDVDAKKFEKRRLLYGDIILEKSGGGPKQAVGRVALFDKPDGDFSFSNFTSALRVIDTKALDFRFLHRFLFWMHLSGVTEGMQSHSTGIRNLDVDAYKAIRISYPPLSEQQRIVTILDEVFGGIATAKANAEKNLQNVREVFESERESKLAGNGPGWRSAPLSELCSIKHGFAFQGEFFRPEGRYVLLTPGNFYEAGGYRDREEKQKYYIGDVPDGYILSKGDLLVAMTEQAAGLLGSPILVPASDMFLHNQRLGLVAGNSGVPWCNEYFFHVFNTKGLRAAVHASGSGVKVRHTSPSKIGEVIVSYPTDVGTQSEIAAAIQNLQEECDKLACTYSQKLDALDELKQSLLHRAFNGDL